MHLTQLGFEYMQLALTAIGLSAALIAWLVGNSRGRFAQIDANFKNISQKLDLMQLEITNNRILTAEIIGHLGISSTAFIGVTQSTFENAKPRSRRIKMPSGVKRAGSPISRKI
jgi:translation initiation factor RLI1